uniref:Uncharacterized protein LOC111112973 n=1 Tax=Crassostrea virginica TaxID=6565 RepID=A0A8B8BUL1_CRAVI|nr:uncharacterized protein LOC111112973 [Crassostrea virginica]
MDYGCFTVEEIDLLEFTFSEDDKLLQTINLDVFAENTALSSENVSIEMAKNETEPPKKRFKTTSNAEMEKLFEARQAPNTKRNTSWGLKIFQEWNLETNGCLMDMETVEPLVLANSLGRFYCEARPQPKKSQSHEYTEEPHLYHKNSLINIRAAINRHLADLRRDIDIVHDKEFKTSNGILDGLFKERTRQGLSKPTKHKAIIDEADLRKIYSYLQGAKTSPIILRQAVWYFLAVHFVSRGMEFHHQLQRNSFEFHEDESGKYATLKHDTLQKTFQGGLTSNDDQSTEKRMYATNDPSCCPVELLTLLIEKTDKNASFLFNQYFRDSAIDADKWFAAKPLSKRTFASFLGEICTAAGVQKKYTPHCLRATAITYLNDSGFEARHIMFMSNHKNESSLRSYNRSVSSNQKKSLSKTLSSMASASRSPTPRVQNENTALLPIPVLANVNMPPPIPQNIELTSNVVNTQEINPNAGFFNNSSFSNCTFNFTK